MHQHREIGIVAFLEFLAFADCFLFNTAGTSQF
jgi:hypothetical protein